MINLVTHAILDIKFQHFCYKILGKKVLSFRQLDHVTSRRKKSFSSSLLKNSRQTCFLDRFWSAGISSGCQQILQNRLSTISIMGNYHCHNERSNQNLLVQFSLLLQGVKIKITNFVLKTGFSRQKKCRLPCAQLLLNQPLLSYLLSFYLSSSNHKQKSQFINIKLTSKLWRNSESL